MKKPTMDERIASARVRLIEAPPEVHIERTVPYRQAWSLIVPRGPGVYLIHDLRGVLYVGRGGNIRKRFEDHRDGSHNFRLRRALQHPVGELKFSWLHAEYPEQVAHEKALIRAFQPLCNDTLYVTSN